MTQGKSTLTSHCTYLTKDTPQKLIFVQQVSWYEMAMRWLVLIFYGLSYVSFLPMNGFFLWKLLFLHGEIQVNCTTLVPDVVNCDLSQSQFGGVIRQRQTLTNPEFLDPPNWTQGTGCYYSLVNIIMIKLSNPPSLPGCYNTLITIDVSAVQLQGREKSPITIQQWSKITFIEQYPFIPETRIDFFQINQPNSIPFTAKVDYRREPGLLLAIAVVVCIWGGMTFLLYYLTINTLRPKQRLILDKQRDHWHFQSFISPQQDECYPLKTVSCVIFEQVIHDQQATTCTVVIPLQNEKTYQFPFSSHRENAKTFARKIAQFLPVDLIQH